MVTAVLLPLAVCHYAVIHSRCLLQYRCIAQNNEMPDQENDKHQRLQHFSFGDYFNKDKTRITIWLQAVGLQSRRVRTPTDCNAVYGTYDIINVLAGVKLFKIHPNCTFWLL
jgi:hypothetical protein